MPPGRLEPRHVGIADILRHELLKRHLDADPGLNALLLETGLKLGILVERRDQLRVCVSEKMYTQSRAINDTM